MTCIVGLVNNGTVYIGGDSAGVADYSIHIRADHKVFKNGNFVFGFTSSFRMGQLLRYNFKPPVHDKCIDIFEYMVTSFIDKIRDCLKSGGFAEKKDEVEKGGFFLVGYSGRLFQVQSDYQVSETINGMEAIGCGEDIALGSLYSTQNKHPQDRILLALEAAEYFNGAVRRPFVIEQL